MKNKYIETKINLKTGFFKKELYLLILNDQEIILKQDQKKHSKEFSIKIPSVKTISILSKKPQEIEIITETENFVGSFIDEENISEIIVFLKMIFDKKFNYY